MAAKDFKTLTTQNIDSPEHNIAKKLQERLGDDAGKIQSLEVVPYNGDMGHVDTVVLKAEKTFSRDNLTRMGLEEIPYVHSAGGRRDHHGHYVTEGSDDHTQNTFLIKTDALLEKLGVSLGGGRARTAD